jgi:predicted glycoside hydrolase/deacetylase ChbG (UPF0249 family)
MAAHLPTTPKSLIVCADDFAANASVSLGIAQLAQRRRISATSVMVLSPRWPQDAALLQGLRAQIDVGLHLDWTSEFAVQAGHGLSLHNAMRRAWMRGFDPKQAQMVIQHQLDLFEAQWQAPPDYVDGHQHVQQFAGIRQALVQVLTQRYGNLPAQPYLRISRAPAGSADLKTRVIAWMGANALKKIATNNRLTSTSVLSGIYNFSGTGADYARHMKRWLQQTPAGGIIMCHPAQAIEAGDEIGMARRQEYNYLSSSEFADALQQAQVVITRGVSSRIQG